MFKCKNIATNLFRNNKSTLLLTTGATVSFCYHSYNNLTIQTQEQNNKTLEINNKTLEINNKTLEINNNFAIKKLEIKNETLKINTQKT